MSEVTLLGPGGATEAKQLPDNHQVVVSNQPSEYPLPAAQIATLTPPDAISGFSLETTQQAIGAVLSAFSSGNHADLLAILTRLGQTLAISAASLPLPAGAATEAKQLPDNHQVAVSNTEFPLPAAQVATLTPQTDALTRAQLDAEDVDVRTEASAEREYTPGLRPTLVTAAGDTPVFVPDPGKAWILHWSYAVPVTRGAEEGPVITIKTVNAANALIANHFIATAVSKSKRITMPVDARLVVNLDLAVRVPCTFDIEQLP